MAIRYDEIELSNVNYHGNPRLNSPGTTVRVQTEHGYVDVGPGNSSWSHFSTDRAAFYFNTSLHSAGVFSSYSGDLDLQRAGTSKITAGANNIYIKEGIRIQENWGQGDYSAEQLSIVGSYPSITFRNNSVDHKWLFHHDGNGKDFQFYEGNDWDSNSWTKRVTFRNSSGGIEAYRFADIENASYYVEPASQSNLNILSLTGRFEPDDPDGYVSSTISGLTNAPIYYPESNVGTSNVYVPHTHSRTRYSSGYRAHISTGVHALASSWNYRYYIAQGGNDSYPTKALEFDVYNNNIYHSDGFIRSAEEFRAPQVNIGAYSEVLGLIGMGSAYRYGMGISSAYTCVYAHNYGSGVQLGSYDGSTFSAKLTVSHGGDTTATTSSRAPIFYDSNDTNLYVDPSGTSVLNYVTATEYKFRSSTNNARFNGVSDWGTRLYTDSGYIQFGPANSGHAHIYTDRSNFYFNKQIQLLGVSQINQNDIRTPILYDSNDTNYYANPAGTSVFNTITVTSGTINMNNNDGFVYDDGANVMKVKYDGTTYNIWTQANDGSGSGLDADLLDGSQGSYYDQRQYTRTDNYLGGYYVSGGTEKPNSSVFGAGKLKIAMLRNTNLGFSGSWNDVLWISTYTGGDVKRSSALVFSKYDNTSMYIVKQNYDATDWGTGYLFWNSGNDGSGSGLDADLLDGVQGSSFLRSDTADTFSGALSCSVGSGATGIDMNNADIVGLNWLRWDDDGEGLIYPGGESFYWSGSLWQFTGGYVLAQGSMRAPTFYDSDNTAFYGNFGASDYSAVVNGGIKFGSTNAESKGGFIGRHGSGGSLNTDAYPSPLYSIGDSYRPSGTGLSNHYGVGYAHTNASFYGLAGQSGWGFYVSADGDARVQLNGSNGTMSCTGDVVAYASDGRLKENVKPIENALDKVMKIRGVSYDWVENITEEYDFHPTKMHEVGVIAQEVQAVLPEVVTIAPFDTLYSQKTGWKKVQKQMESELGREVTKAEAKTEYEKLPIEEQESLQEKNDFLTVNYEKIVPLLIEAIKEQQKQIDELKSLINK